MKLRALTLGVWLLVVVNGYAQTQTTGQISGVIADATDAVVPKAQITVVNKDTGLKRTTESNPAGHYVVPLLDPANYTVTVSATGLQTVSREGVRVEVGHSVLLDFRLEVGTRVEKVTVSTQPPLIEPINPNTTTTFNATQLANVPNPGNDLSYVANLAPGAVMNTGSAGFGNVEFNGLPADTNNFSIDGLDANNPYFNLNATGASGLQLGLNAIQEVSINTASYSVDQGRQEAAQINYITKSGTNSFHGNAYEIWNGSAMNARNFFNNALGVKKKPRSNVNEFGASVGGPILKNKLFFFTDLEGIRIVLPTTLTSTLPTPAYQAFVLQQLPLGGMDLFPNPQTGNSSLPPEPAEVPFYQNMFKLIGNPSGGIPLAVLGCPLNADGSPASGSPPDGNGCATRKTSSVTPPVRETLFTIKFDYTLSPRDTFWFRFQLNDGTSIKPDPVNSIFNSIFSAPARSAAAGWTHVFNSNLVNQFNPGLSYNKNLFNIANPTEAHAVFPITYRASVFSAIGGTQSFRPGGQASTIWQLNDNLSWTKGKHSAKFGANLRRVLISDFSRSLFVIPSESAFSLPEFTFGAAASTSQSFPNSLGDRLAWVNFDLYAMDTFRATNRLTLTFGVRTAWNSNPVSQQNVFSRLSGSFGSITHDVNQPLNQVILANQAHPFASTPLLQWQPRAALAYEVTPKTVFRAGFGIFATALEGGLGPALLAGNAPSDATFSGGLFGAVGGIAIAPGVPGSAVDAAVAANRQFQANFASGALSCQSSLSSPATCIPQLGFSSFSGGREQYPYSMQWSAAVEHQFRYDFGLIARYQGTRAVKMIFDEGTQNVAQLWCQGCFAPLPFNTPLDPRFGTVQTINTGASSSYHALQVTGQKRMSHGLLAQLNYTYSHCLDTISNGGWEFFNAGSSINPLPVNLKHYYGNCDYDIRHSVNGSYLYELPVHPKRAWLNNMIGGWQFAGTVFLRGGFPFSVYSNSFSNFTGGFPLLFADLVPGQNPYTKTNIPGVTQPGTVQWLNPNAVRSVIDVTTNTCFPSTSVQNCRDGNSGRNHFRGPGFRWTDLDIGKQFKLSEKIGFRFDAQFYNLFNHPNFNYPSFGFPLAGIPGKPATLTGFGAIGQTVSPETGLLGSHLGGDSSVRMIALRGRIEF